MVQNKRMDNAAYQRDVEQRGAALEMKATATKSTSARTAPSSSGSPNGREPHSSTNNNITSTTIQIGNTPIRTDTDRLAAGKNFPKLLGGSTYNTLPSTSCRPDVCQAARRRYAPPDLAGSPWHRYKTIFLLLTLILLALWIVIYATLNSLNIL